jgi:undecaprenyl-diphosphatase
VGWLFQLNYALFTDLNDSAGHSALVDALMVFCADRLIFFMPFVLLLVWGRPTEWHKRPSSVLELDFLQARRFSVLWAIVACVVALGINKVVSLVAYEPRPFVTHHVHLLVTHAADSSFPSDHAAVSFSVIFTLFFVIRPWLQKLRDVQIPGLSPRTYMLILLFVSLAIGCLIGFARVYVGVHYPDDIIGGAISGLLASMFVCLFSRWLSVPTSRVLHFAHRLRLA